MKLDPKINGVHDILTPFDTKEATDHIGKYCAFADDIEDFKDIGDFGSVRYGELKRVKENQACPFEYELTVSHLIATAKFCLPYARLKKKYRPFSIEDWKLKHSIGETVLYRSKVIDHGDRYEAELMYLGYIKPLDGITDEVGAGELVLGKNSHSLQYLFDNYEIWVDGGWKPFGVEDTE